MIREQRDNSPGKEVLPAVKSKSPPKSRSNKWEGNQKLNIKKIKEVIVEQKESDLMSIANVDTVRSSFQVSQEQLNLILNDPTTTQQSLINTQPDVIDEIVKVNNNPPEPIISDRQEEVLQSQPDYGIKTQIRNTDVTGDSPTRDLEHSNGNLASARMHKLSE